jgi:hypothetical protein
MNTAAHSISLGQVIPPASGRLETMLFVLATLGLVGVTTGYILLKPKAEGPPPLLSWQVSSFDGLSPVDQAIHSALLPAADEIVWGNNDTGQWMTMEQAQETLLPPFYKDNFWKVNGEVNWQVIMPGAVGTGAQEAPKPEVSKDPIGPPPSPNAVYQGTLGQGTATYYGSGGKAPGQSTYLIVIGHAHSGVYWINQATLWIHKDPNTPIPDVMKPEALVSRGWRQIIPYNGASEVERVQGKS